jgi:hypothetical protein
VLTSNEAVKPIDLEALARLVVAFSPASPHLHKLIQGHGPPQDDLQGALDAGDGLEIGDAFPFCRSVQACVVNSGHLGNPIQRNAFLP